MQLHLSTWPEVEDYLETSKTIILPVGSTEQHGPTGLVGTDALCPGIIANAAAEIEDVLIGPTFNVGVAQHHMSFPGSMAVRPSTMIAAMNDWMDSLYHQGFRTIYWFNGHGGNVPTLGAAVAEFYHKRNFGPSVSSDT
ncbi:MAG: creatininase family protein, partial [Pseudomonadota bacterium]